MPVAPTRLNPELPAEFERIVHKALEKDRKLRYQHASDLRADFERLKRDSDSGRAHVMESANVSADSNAPLAGPAPAAGSGSGRTAPPAEARPSQVADRSSSSTVVEVARQNKGKLVAFALVILALVAAAAYGIRALLRSSNALDNTQTDALSKILVDPIKGGNVETLIRMQDKILANTLWLPSGRGLVTRYTERISPIARAQIGYVSDPEGRIHHYHARHQRLQVAVSLRRRKNDCNRAAKDGREPFPASGGGFHG